MKKILLLGKLNEVLKDVDQALAGHFHVQICDLKSDMVAGMLKVVEPDLVVVSLVGAQDYDTAVFTKLALTETPVLTIGSELEKKTFLRFYSNRQFEHLTRPVSNFDILRAACTRLHLDFSVMGDQIFLKEQGAKKNVLVVDDNPVTLRAIKEMLSDDFDITAATSGVQAMTAIGRRRPDVILLDYEMPVCDGKQTLEMIKTDEELKDIPVIFLTAISDRAHIEGVLSLKPAGYLLKPASRDMLVETIFKSI